MAEEITHNMTRLKTIDMIVWEWVRGRTKVLLRLETRRRRHGKEFVANISCGNGSNSEPTRPICSALTPSLLTHDINGRLQIAHTSLVKDAPVQVNNVTTTNE